MNLKKLGPPLIPRPSKPNWILKNHGALDGELNMSIDQNALDDLTTGHRESPILRLFEWAKPTITYGYLLDLEKVKRWAEDFEKAPIIKRPTGGGAVFHKTSDLSLSFLWPRKKGVLPENPRDCYKKIHALLKEGVEKYLTRGTKLLSLYSSPPCLPAGRQVGEGREGGVVSPLIDKSKDEQHPAPYPRPPACRQAGKGAGKISFAAANRRFSVCFQEPVCNDVMLDKKKIIGGALRITKQAILYQGTIQLKPPNDVAKLKESLIAVFSKRLSLSPL